ncbi:MAG: DUF2461 domain-containing protein [Bacteroidia bacterium]|nr:DUF2461 domain-containing protein [Bacteroidia bacterium]
MKQIISFLNALSQNNNREWFLANKKEYEECKAKFEQFTDELIAAVSEFDPTIRGLKAKDCTYRIYRDVRFSADKSPYKTHFGCYIVRGGKKSGYNGYYFHISTGQENNYPHAHMIAVGDYCMDPKILALLREDIQCGGGDFEQTILQAQGYRLDSDQKLKRMPKGFEEGCPYADYIKYKAFCLYQTPSTDYILSPNLVSHVASEFQKAKPFLDYINRAIEYHKEGNQD